MVGGVFNLQERQVQIEAGVEDKEIARYLNFIRSAMTDQHRKFFAEREVMYVAVEAEGATSAPAAGVIVGPAGFMSTPDEMTVLLDLSVAAAYGFDASHFQKGTQIGFLGLEHETRRRNRVNGHITSVSDVSVSIHVDQSFGNCPKYIQKRPVGFDPSKLAMLPHNKPATHAPDAAEEADKLAGIMLEMVTSADTFFIGSEAQKADGYGGPNGVDMSHRGGPEGFVKVSSDGKQLRWADFRGNHFFMSLGNIAATGRVCLLFCDYITGAAVTISGHARIDWEDKSLPGAERAIVVDISHCRELVRGSIPFRAGPVTGWSPHNPAT